MSAARRAAYRVGQAASMLRGGMSIADRSEVEDVLPRSLHACFYRMNERDQRHAVRVLRRARRVAAPGVDPELLLQAALLHDVGKAEAALGIPGRSIVVLAGAARSTALLRRVPIVGRRFDAYLRHPAVGARMLREAGAPPRLVSIVEEHQQPHPRQPETAVLQELDGSE